MRWGGEKSDVESGGQDAQWQEMANSVTTERAAAEKAQLAKERQQRKMMGYFLSGDNNCLAEKDVNLPEGSQQEVLKRINQGEIDDHVAEEMLLKLRGPIDQPGIGMGAGRIYEKITQDPWQTQLLAMATGENWISERADPARGASVVTRLVNYQTPDIDLRTPVGFEERRKAMLEQIRPQVDQATFDYYETSMDKLEKNLYGKRFEYYQAYKDLKAQAEEAEAGSTEQLMRHQETYYLGNERSRELMAAARVDGDAWYQDGAMYELTPEILEQEGLAPRYGTKVDGHEIALSDVYEIGNGRLVAEAYIPTADGVKVRSYYRSNSQGVWRYLPDYVRDANGGSIRWYGKGRSEESITLPHELQESLATIQNSAGVRRPDTFRCNPAFLFAGTAKAYDSKDQYSECLQSGYMRGDYYNEVAPRSQSAEFGAISRSKHAPDSLVTSFGMSPDFTKMETSYDSQSATAGALRTEVFRSQDGQKNWIFCRDKQGRAYVGGIEVDSPLTSTGLRQQWIEGGDIVTPLYEYQVMADGYGDEQDTKGRYQCMWQKYLSKIPVIKQYIETRER